MGRRTNMATPQQETLRLADLYRRQATAIGERLREKKITKKVADDAIARTAQAETRAGEDAITVKLRLSHGEREEMFRRMALNGRGQSRTDTVVAYLLGWNLKDDADKKIPYTSPRPKSDEEYEAAVSTICGLETDVFDEIHEAINQHVVRQAEIREKNDHDGERVSGAISPSVEQPA